MEEPGFWDNADRATKLVQEAKNLKEQASKIGESVKKVTAQMDAYAKELKSKAAAK